MWSYCNIWWKISQCKVYQNIQFELGKYHKGEYHLGQCHWEIVCQDNVRVQINSIMPYLSIFQANSCYANQAEVVSLICVFRSPCVRAYRISCPASPCHLPFTTTTVPLVNIKHKIDCTALSHGRITVVKWNEFLSIMV